MRQEMWNRSAVAFCKMHLKLWIFFVAAFASVSCGRNLNFPPREKLSHEEKDENFILVGASSHNPKITFNNDDEEGNKALRSSYYSMYPMMIHQNSPASSHSHHQPQNHLLNLNLGLLEPFMLITFLLFVLCLIDKAKLINISRNDFDQNFYGHQHLDLENFHDFIKRNSSEF
jgi:hypothetical protein